MNNEEIKKGLRKLRDSIDDFLDNMDMDAEDDQPKKKSPDAMKDDFNHPNSKKPPKDKLPSEVEEDTDGKKKEN